MAFEQIPRRFARDDNLTFVRQIMRHRWMAIIGTVLPAVVDAQTGRGPYARIAILRPYEGHFVDFEAGYVRHLEWHRQARDPWVWYGWSVWASERQRWFIYATFGHSAAGLDSSVVPADDERDNVLNVVPHAEFAGNALYEYLPQLSRGTGEPQPTARLELTTVDLVPGAAKMFEAAIGAGRSTLQGETLWYRMVAGGTAPRYVRLRTRPSLSAVLDGTGDQELPNAVYHSISRMTVEILTLRPTMSLGVAMPARD
jgi:hypothetical protein